MKKIFFALMLLCSLKSFSQLSVDTYIFKVENGKPYLPLTSGTNLTSGLVWDDECFKIPLGFTADIGGKSINDFSIDLSRVFGPSTDTIGEVTTFYPLLADILDRSISPIPISPVRYMVTGTMPNRIFKFEVSNAGFWQEWYDYGTMDDYINFQIYLYEKSNIVEFHYGPSRVSNIDDYFSNDGPVIGYSKNIDVENFTVDKFYSLTGTPSNPTIDSAAAFSEPVKVIVGYPSNGTVYRFIPKSVAASIGEVDLTKYFEIYPTVFTDFVTVQYNLSSKASAQIMDVSGRFIGDRIDLVNGKNQINCSHLSSGQYLIQMSNGDGNVAYQIIKQ